MIFHNCILTIDFLVLFHCAINTGEVVICQVFIDLYGVILGKKTTHLFKNPERIYLFLPYNLADTLT